MPAASRDLNPIAQALFSGRTGIALWAVAIGAASYLLLLVLHTWGALLPERVLSGLALYRQALAIICAGALAIQAATMFGLMARNDEFMRSLVFKRTARAALITVLLITAWSVIAAMGWLPAFEPIYLYAAFLAVHTALIPFMNADRP